MVGDRKVDPNSFLARHPIVVPLAVSTSITSRAFWQYTVGFLFEVRRILLGAVAYTSSCTIQAYIIDGDGAVVAGALAIDSTPEKFKLALSRYFIGGVYLEKAAATALTFSDNHTIAGANKWGAFLVQITSGGTVSTKNVGDAQAYATEAAAIAALPSADSGKLAIGYITVQAKNSTWTANTDDMTASSDCVAANFYTTPATATAVLTSATGFTAQSSVEAALSTTLANRRGRDTATLLLCYTTDGTGAVTNGMVTVELAARALAD